ncbi:MAG: hypothetical protein AAFQ32_11490 [Pseudomonadota bacterium]
MAVKYLIAGPLLFIAFMAFFSFFLTLWPAIFAAWLCASIGVIGYIWIASRADKAKVHKTKPVASEEAAE